MVLARAISSGVPRTSTRNLPALTSASYLRAWFLGTPQPTSAPDSAPMAAPARAPSRPPSTAAENGPAMITGPTPGRTRNAAPRSSPNNPPIHAPVAAPSLAKSPVLKKPIGSSFTWKSRPTMETSFIANPSWSSRRTAYSADS